MTVLTIRTFLCTLMFTFTALSGDSISIKLHAAKKLAKARSLNERAGRVNDDNVNRDRSTITVLLALSELVHEIAKDIDQQLEDQLEMDTGMVNEIDDEVDDETEELVDGEVSKEQKEHQRKTDEALLEAIDHCYQGYREIIVDWRDKGVRIDRAHPVCRALRELYQANFH